MNEVLYRKLRRSLRRVDLNMEGFRHIFTPKVHALCQNSRYDSFPAHNDVPYPHSCKTPYDRWSWDLFTTQCDSYRRGKVRAERAPPVNITFPCCYQYVTEPVTALPDRPVCPHCLIRTKTSKLVLWSRPRPDPVQNLRHWLAGFLCSDLVHLAISYLRPPKKTHLLTLAAACHVCQVGDSLQRNGHPFIRCVFDRDRPGFSCTQTYEPYHTLFLLYHHDRPAQPWTLRNARGHVWEPPHSPEDSAYFEWVDEYFDWVEEARQPVGVGNPWYQKYGFWWCQTDGPA